ncbi:aldo/keto reductase, partial [Ilumatobacter sp.]|uniref:aldo/keto reductase n=1 Tax=Ilumatobacter sp. TaxID=1967498 RepID=UPI003C56463B
FTSVAEDAATDLVAAAFEAGISYFDTAPQYGHGLSEQRLGRALAGLDRDSFTVATKVGRLVVANPDAVGTEWFPDAPPSDAVFAFDRDSILRSIDKSLERLGLDRLDVVQIHDPDDVADQAIEESYPVLHELRDQGVIRAIGVGMNQSAVPTRFITETDIDAVLLAGRYTLLDQSATADLIPAARAAGVSVLIGGVFNSGILADPDNSPRYDYLPASPEVIARAHRIRDVCRRHHVDLIQAALAFVMRERAVTSVLLGARSRSELEQSLAIDVDTVPDELWRELSEEGLIHELDG